jgi:hypothetical protein
MTTLSTGNTRVISEPLRRSLPLIRRLLLDAGLSIIAELDVSGTPHLQAEVATRSCTVLLVDTPLLLLEAIALDRAGAIFLPIHVVISGEGDTSYVFWANPMMSSGLRPPAPSKGPLEDLCARITKAFSELPHVADPVTQTQSC